MLKPFALSLLMVSSLTLASTPDAISAFQLIEQQQYQQANQQLDQLLKARPNDIELMRLKIRTSLRQKDLDSAEELIEQLTKAHENSAKVQFLRGGVYGNIAGQASIFSALGYAKKSLNSFKQAVKLEPNNLDYHQALMSFYLGAPSIAGGDEKKALEQVQAIEKLDKNKGLLAKIRYYSRTDNQALLEPLLAQYPAEKITDLALATEIGFSYQKRKQFAKAASYFQQIQKIGNSSHQPEPTNNQPTSLADYEQQLEQQNRYYMALYQIGKSCDESNSCQAQGIEALEQYIAAKPSAQQLPELDWAQFRLANLYRQQGDLSKAKPLYAQLVTNTKDKELKKKAKKYL